MFKHQRFKQSYQLHVSVSLPMRTELNCVYLSPNLRNFILSFVNPKSRFIELFDKETGM